ncbi:MAG: hypothetical protein JRG97_08210 [Deltaproteobacteria bacterium]|nr:hypothetical protein [Deltaproteobacteria bacterium]MBW2052226.1 hypothetical protein [Deltaproteobacteria bacterium]MBW2141041.1 hypothetical protein [Deltaproteobacteria bacterium]MBW2323484.1 hypothetical protein [Deltaproteobacteria bacterium]
MSKQRILTLIITLGLCFGLIMSGCATKKGPGPQSFKSSSLKKRIAVIPFQNNTGFGNNELGRRITNTIAQQLNQSGKVIVVSQSKVDAYLKAQGIPQPLTQNTATLIGRGLKLNAIILGAISAINLTDKRIGWRVFIPIFKKQEIVSASLVVRVVDVEDGTFLLTETGQGNTLHDSVADQEWLNESKGTLDRTSVEKSLAMATESLTRSILEALARAPWKGFIKSVSGSTATLCAGRDVGIKAGQRFVVYSIAEKITNTAGKTYVIPGSVKATLEVTRVLDGTSEAKIISGQVLAGDAIHFTG